MNHNMNDTMNDTMNDQNNHNRVTDIINPEVLNVSKERDEEVAQEIRNDCEVKYDLSVIYVTHKGFGSAKEEYEALHELAGRDFHIVENMKKRNGHQILTLIDCR